MEPLCPPALGIPLSLALEDWALLELLLELLELLELLLLDEELALEELCEEDADGMLVCVCGCDWVVLQAGSTAMPKAQMLIQVTSLKLFIIHLVCVCCRLL